MGSKRHGARTKRQQRKSWLPLGLIALGVVLLIGLSIVSFTQTAAQNVTPPRVGAPLSNFTLTDLDGRKIHLSDYRGKVILVNAWAIWCPPCRAEMPDINAYFQAHQKDGFMVLAVNAGDSQASAAAFAKTNHLAFPVLLDTDLRLLDRMGIHNFPTSIVLGRDGQVKRIQVGMFSPKALDSIVTPLLFQ